MIMIITTTTTTFDFLCWATEHSLLLLLMRGTVYLQLYVLPRLFITFHREPKTFLYHLSFINTFHVTTQNASAAFS